VMSANGGSPGLLHIVVCAAPAAANVDEFVRLAQEAEWTVRVIATPMAERVIDAGQLAELTGRPGSGLGSGCQTSPMSCRKLMRS
jgi:hypothetical protein